MLVTKSDKIIATLVVVAIAFTIFGGSTELVNSQINVITEALQGVSK